MKKLVILTGAGMSSESGIRTFRDSGGLWEEYEVTAVATPEADIFAVIGSSLNVYPAAGLIAYVPYRAPIYLIDPKDVAIPGNRNVEVIKEVASTGVGVLTARIVATKQSPDHNMNLLYNT